MDEANPPAGRSERLTYEKLRRDHAAELFPLLSDPQVYAHIEGDPPASLDALARKYAAIAAGPQRPEIANQTWRDCCVRRSDTGQAIGVVEATVIGDTAEIAYLFGVTSWGYGYAHEAMTWYHAWLAEQSPIASYWATILPTNQRSIRLAQRLGYTRVEDESLWPDLRSYDPGDWVYAKR
ncbi:MAG: GNAT family N-acetyltransferase [Planctomycetota bacterium]